MYSTPENYETIMTGARNIWYEGTITTVAEDVYEFNASNIVTGTGSINRRITDGTSLAIGSVTAAQFDIKLYWQNIDRYELYDAEISVTCYIENGDQSPIEIPMGIFYINEVTQDATTVSITAYDAMLKFDLTYVHTVANDTPYQWLTRWCSTCGVTLGTSPLKILYTMPNGGRNMSLDIDSVSDITTFRDALSYLCTALCAVAFIGRDGKLYIENYGMTVAKTFNQSQRYSSTLSDYVCYYTHLTSVYGETVENYVDTSYSGEDDGITLDIDVNPFLQITDADTRNAACQAILTKLASVHYAPYEVSLPARPELDIMDVIGFTGGQADAQDFGAIMDITYNFHSSMSISCAGDNPKTIKENKYVKTIKNVSRLAKQNDDFAGLLANAYGMYRTEIEDPVIEGAYAYALHNASTYNTSTFAVLLDADGLFMLTRDTVYDDWDIASITASDGAALIETLTANSAIIDTLLSRDVTVTGSLHSDDYVPAATGASPPYAQAGMGLDFGEKEFEAENFAIDSSGKVYAKAGEIGGWDVNEYGFSKSITTIENGIKYVSKITLRPRRYGKVQGMYLPVITFECGQAGVEDPDNPDDTPVILLPMYETYVNGDVFGNKFLTSQVEATTGGSGASADDVPFFTHANSGSVGLRAKRDDTNADVFVGVGSLGTTYGLWSNTLRKWMVWGNSTGVKLEGLAQGIDATPTYTVGGSVSVPNTTFTQVQTVSLDAGVWLIEYGVSFQTNANGYRQIAFTTTSSTPTPDRTMPTSPAVSGTSTTVVKTAIVEVSTATTGRVWAYQNSGAARTVWPYIRTFKLR